MAKNIEMNIKKEDGYEVLYPNVKANSVIDFTGDNPLLKEETVALFAGLPENPVPDDVFHILSKAVLVSDNGIIFPNGENINNYFIEHGTYIGTGTGGPGNPISITFKKPPIFVVICGESHSRFEELSISRNNYCFWVKGANFMTSTSVTEIVASISGNTLTYYAKYSFDNEQAQFNIKSKTYSYIGFYQ